MAKEQKKLDELFHDTLKDIYFAEKKILATLPKMAKAAQSEELRAAFEKHHGETEGQVERLEQVFGVIDKKPQGKTCAAIVGITDEGAEIMQEYKGSPALDAGLLALRRRSNTTRFPAMARLSRGPKNWVLMMRSRFCRRRLMRKRPQTTR
jgi:ferritin-like metal-binding protein YciE